VRHPVEGRQSGWWRSIARGFPAVTGFGHYGEGIDDDGFPASDIPAIGADVPTPIAARWCGMASATARGSLSSATTSWLPSCAIPGTDPCHARNQP